MSRPRSVAVIVLASFRRDFLIAARRPAEAANPLVFFVMVCTLFPLGLGPAPEVLRDIAPGALWVVALLASLMASENLFRQDWEDRSLELLLMSPVPLSVLVLARVLAHWALTGLPLTLLSPLLSLMFQLPDAGRPALFVSLLCGTLILTLIGAIGAALTVGLRQGGLLLSLLILPLYVPPLIFGSMAVAAGVGGGDWQSLVAILGGAALIALVLAPVAIAGALRISSE